MCRAEQGKDISDRKRANLLSELAAIKHPTSELKPAAQTQGGLLLNKEIKKGM